MKGTSVRLLQHSIAPKSVARARKLARLMDYHRTKYGSLGPAYSPEVGGFMAASSLDHDYNGSGSSQFHWTLDGPSFSSSPALAPWGLSVEDIVKPILRVATTPQGERVRRVVFTMNFYSPGSLGVVKRPHVDHSFTSIVIKFGLGLAQLQVRVDDSWKCVNLSDGDLCELDGEKGRNPALHRVVAKAPLRRSEQSLVCFILDRETG